MENDFSKIRALGTKDVENKVCFKRKQIWGRKWNNQLGDGIMRERSLVVWGRLECLPSSALFLFTSLRRKYGFNSLLSALSPNISKTLIFVLTKNSLFTFYNVEPIKIKAFLKYF